MSEVTQFYLTSMWGYTAAGAEKVIQALQDCGLESGEFTYEPEFRWFNAACLKKDISRVLQRYSAISVELEGNLEYEELVDGDATPRDETESPWLEDPRDDFWPGNQESPVAKAVKTSLPPDFHKFNAKSVWRCDEESAKLDSVLTLPIRAKLQEVCGVMLSWDVTMGVVYIGGDSEGAVNMVKRKLDILLASSKLESPPQQHVFYPEDSKTYLVDVRFVGLINPGIVTSTIFDPAEFRIGKQYARLQEQSVGLRASVPSEVDSSFTSLFGPRARALFPEKDKQSPFTPFNGYVYATKSASLPAGAASAVTNVGNQLLASPATENPVANWANHVQDAGTSTPRSMSLASGGDTPMTQAVDPLGDVTGPLRDLRLSERIELEAEKADIEQKLAMLQAKEVGAGGDGGSSTAPSQNPVALLSHVEEQYTRAGVLPSAPVAGGRLGLVDNGTAMSPNASSSAQTFSAWQDVLKSANAHADSASNLRNTPAPSKLLKGPDARTSSNEEQRSRVYHETMKQQAPPRALAEGHQGDEIMGADFQHDIKTALARLVGYARTKAGGLSLRLEFGRIFMTKMPFSAIAHNAPGQYSNGWEPQMLIKLLNNKQANAKLIHFTRVLTLYAPDAEYLAKMRDKDTREAMWHAHLRKVVYEFRCQRLLPNGSMKEFIIDVDGSEGAGFRYRIRAGPRDIEPVWVHCLHRHWDCRVVLQHADSVALQAECGRFAKFLTSSLTIPSNTQGDLKLLWLEDAREQITVVRLRVRNVARYLSADKQSNLDVTRVRDVPVQLIQEPRVRKRLADVNDRVAPREGVFDTWFEACITSVQGEQLFSENAEMTIGDQASWTLETFKTAKVFESLYGPAVKMIQRMDGVGVSCENGVVKGKTRDEEVDAGGDERAASLTEKSVMAETLYRAKERRYRVEGTTRW